MRIIYLSSPPFADCDFPLVKEFQQLGHDIYYFIDLPQYFLKSNIINIKRQINKDNILRASEYKEFELFKNYINMEHIYVINRTKNSAFDIRNIKLELQLISFIKRINPDIILLTKQPEIFSCLLYQFRKKIVLTVHDPFPHTGEVSMRRMFFRKIAFKIIPKFVLLNQNQKEEFQKTWKLKDEQISINRLGSYDCTLLFLKHSEIHKSKPNILFYGRISPYKGIEYLLEAMKIVHNKIPEATLTIAGSGKMYFDTTQYEKLPYIEFQNHYIEMEELAMRLNNCSIVVCPYIDATQSGVVQTSFSMNKPVIATNVGAMKEYINNGCTGLLVPPRDSVALSDAIIEVFETKGLLEYMENNLKNMIYDKDFGWQGIASKYIEFFKKDN